MSSSRITTSTALILGIALVAAGLYFKFGGGTDVTGGAPTGASADPERTPAARKDVDPRAPRPRVALSSDRLQLGTLSQCGEPKIAEIILTNDGEVPAKVDGWISSCGCISVLTEPGFLLDPGDARTVPIRIDAWGVGTKNARLDFRLAGNAVGARLVFDYTVSSPIRTRPSIVIRSELSKGFLVELERSADDGSHVDEAFNVLGVLPPVATVWAPAEGEAPLDPGWGGIEIDFAAIDALAAEPDSANDPAFEWKESPKGRKWRSIELLIRTDLPVCGDLRVRVRNH